MVLVQAGQSRMIVGSRKALALAYEAKRGNAGAAKELKTLHREAKGKRAEKTKIKAKIAKVEIKLARKTAVLEELIAIKLAQLAALETVTET